MSLAEIIGWLAAGATLLTFSMRTMLPLRSAALGSNVFFILYGALAGLAPVLVLHLILLPFNLFRLIELLRTGRRIARARAGEIDLAMLRGLSKRRRLRAGEVLFEKGDPADYLYYLLEGDVRLEGLDVRLGPGSFLGEIAFFSEARARTLTARCETDCELLAIDERAFMRIYYQNPAFGVFLMRTITQRLLEGMTTRPDAYRSDADGPR